MSFGNAHTIHAREHHMGWNPANPPVQTVAPGDTVEFDCIDSSGGQITENTGRSHCFFGPPSVTQEFTRAS